jgi:beta-xylosidase
VKNNGQTDLVCVGIVYLFSVQGGAMKIRSSLWYAYWLGVLVLLLVYGVVTVVRGQEPRPLETAAGDNYFVEPFDSLTLNPGWFWVREQGAYWNLNERPGWLRLYTNYGSLDGGVADNILLRAAPTAPYVLTSHFEFSPTLDFQEASLLLYQDDDNYVKMSRLQHSELGGSRYLLTREVNGVKEQGSYIFTEQTDITLRLAVYEGRVFGWYMDTAGEWRILGSIYMGSAGNYPYVGLTAHNGLTVGTPPPSIPADFDYIEAGPAGAIFDLFLPVIRYP